MKTRLPALVQLRKVLEDQQTAAFEAVLDATPKVDNSPQAGADFEFAVGRVVELDARLERFKNIHVNEPDIYAPGLRSFFADLHAIATHAPDQFAAQERLQRHADQVPDRASSQLIAGQARGIIFPADVQNRALSLTTGQGGEFSPPAFLLDEFASVARSASPVLRALPSTPLPPHCFEVYVPRVTSSGGVVVMASENVNAPTAWQSTDQILVAVAMFAGQVPLSQQLFERGPNIDRYLAKDFGENFAATAEQQVIAGTGTGGQMLGLLSLPTAAVDGVPGASLVTWTQASPTPAGLIGQMGQAFADVGNTRLRPPSVAIMTPERFAWTATNKDSEGEPIIRPGTGLVPSNADQGEYGPIAGMPCLLSGEVPQDLGAGANQDAVIVMRTADFMWLPSDPVFEVYTDTADGASEMTVFASWHAYAAFVSARYPSAVATIQGTGMNRSALTYPA